MRTANAALLALIAGNTSIWAADLYDITTTAGAVTRLTNSDASIVWNGNTYSGTGVGIARSSIKWTTKLDVDTLDLEVYATASGNALLIALLRGDYDGATLVLRRAYASTPGASIADAPTLFTGRIADISGGGAMVKVQVRSMLELLDQQFPRNTYQPSCMNTWGDGVCGVNKATYRQTGSVSGSIDPAGTFFNYSGMASNSDGYFNLGVVRFTSGANAGIARAVKLHSYLTTTTGTLAVAVPFPAAIATSDAFEIWPGCAKNMTSCSTRYSNLANFRGMPFIPVPETTL